jgi:hypothetical protein
MFQSQEKDVMYRRILFGVNGTFSDSFEDVLLSY